MSHNTFNTLFGNSGSTLWGGIIPWEEVAEEIFDKAGRFSSTLSGAAADTSAKVSSMVWAIAGSLPVIADSLSGVYNASLGANKSFLQINSSWAASFFQQLSILKAAIVVYLGLNIMRRDAIEVSQAYENKDLDSGVSYALHGAFGMNLSIVGSASLAAEAAKLPAAANVLSASVAGLVATSAGLLMSASLGAYACHGLYHARQFIKGVRGDTSDRTIGEMYADFSKLARTVQQIKRSVGLEGVSALMKELEINDESALVDAIQNVKNLDQKEKILNLVFEHNYRWQARLVRLIVISFVSAAAFTLGLVLTGGLANFLFVFGAILWLTLDANVINQWIGDRIWEWKKDSVLPTALKVESLQRQTGLEIHATDEDKKDLLDVREALLKATLSKSFADSYVYLDKDGKLCKPFESILVMAYRRESRDFIAFDSPKAKSSVPLTVNGKDLVMMTPEDSYQDGILSTSEDSCQIGSDRQSYFLKNLQQELILGIHIIYDSNYIYEFDPKYFDVPAASEHSS